MRRIGNVVRVMAGVVALLIMAPPSAQRRRRLKRAGERSRRHLRKG